MPTYIIEIPVPDAEHMSPSDLRRAVAMSHSALGALGPDVRWLRSYLAGDKIYCVYAARNGNAIRAHARREGVPADRICELGPILDEPGAGLK